MKTGKYEPLEVYLKGIPASVTELNITFQEIEKIIGARLPASAKNHRAWWSNQKDFKNRPQAKAWLSAGWYVESVKQMTGDESVFLKRK